MRALLLVVALACACKRDRPNVSADPDDKKASNPAAIIIKKVVPSVSARAHETRDTSTELKMMLSVGATPPTASGFTRSEHDERTEEVLAVEGRAVTKVRVTYDNRQETSSLPAVGAPTKKALPVSGLTYVVEAVKTGIEVRDNAGKLPPADEVIIVRRDYELLGKEDDVAAGLPDVPLHVGDPVPSMARAIERRLIGKQQIEAKGDVDVHVESVTRELVVFAIKANFVSHSASPMRMEMPLAGTLTVRVADGWVTGFQMDAPLTIGSPDAGSFTGTGSLSMTMKRTYL